MKKLQLLPFVLIFSLQVYAQTKENNTGAKWSYAAMDSAIQSHKGKPYMSFDFTSFDGKRFTNESCKGKVTFISFWFESCGGCRTEFPQINKLYESIRSNPDFQFISVTFDPKESLPEFIKENKINFPVATVSDIDLFKKLNYGMGCPSILILDARGMVGLLGLNAVSETGDQERQISIGTILNTMHKML